MIAKIICFFKGHRRGKFHSPIREGERVVGRMMICPRCDTTWIRKVKG